MIKHECDIKWLILGMRVSAGMSLACAKPAAMCCGVGIILIVTGRSSIYVVNVRGVSSLFAVELQHILCVHLKPVLYAGSHKQDMWYYMSRSTHLVVLLVSVSDCLRRALGYQY